MGTSFFIHLGVKYLALSCNVYAMTTENYENNGQLYAMTDEKNLFMQN